MLNKDGSCRVGKVGAGRSGVCPNVKSEADGIPMFVYSLCVNISNVTITFELYPCVFYVQEAFDLVAINNFNNRLYSSKGSH